MAAYTIQQVLDLARESLNDDDKVRYTDAALLKYANDGLDEMCLLRPDLFIGSFSAAALTDGNQRVVGDSLPVDGRFRRVVADYVIARAEMADDEHAVGGRASAMAKFFETRLVGG